MQTTQSDYQPSEIEGKWQEFWAEKQVFSAEEATEKPKYYVLDMFPYPSGAGLHLGHPANYTPSDIVARFKKAQGYNVLHPQGWDAFGLPTEQYAIKTGVHPAVTSQTNIDRFQKQLNQLGYCYDWQHSVNTTDPEYFRWTQWIFLQLFAKGLAYVDEKPVWWCPALGTVLANEEVIDGKSERGNHPVERRHLRQWVLRITAYAEKMLAGLDKLDWPESSKKLQRHWIGRSTGIEIEFDLENSTESLIVFTTRPDTLYGVTYMVLAPEHPLLGGIIGQEQKKAVNQYQELARNKSELERAELNKVKSGVFTGAFAIHPLSGKKIPIWCADYVVMSYGTGAIMAVPAHDERDYAFAQAFDLPIERVIEGQATNGVPTPLPFCDLGVVTNSGKYSGMSSAEAQLAIGKALQDSGKGTRKVNYKLRDWLFSRQRYWGEPFPIVWISHEDYQRIQNDSNSPFQKGLPEKPVIAQREDRIEYALPLLANQLPLTLPEIDSYQPTGSGESPLAKAEEWLAVSVNLSTGAITPQSKEPLGDDCILGRRETDTMPQWAGSCWYYLRYPDPKNCDQMVSGALHNYWQVPDLYIGGAEHVNLHLLYARFWHLFLYDIGVVQQPEPFPKLVHQGLILAEDGEKMSKSRGNVINPETIIEQYGADTLRLYQCFLGPLEASKPWNTLGIEGIARFLRKIWREIVDDSGHLNPKVQKNFKDSPETDKELHLCIQKVTDDYENLRFNTAISQLMILVNQFQKEPVISQSSAEALLQMLAPLAPHIAEELWSLMGKQEPICQSRFPIYEPGKIVSDTVKLIVQVNGKVRGELLVDKGSDKEDLLNHAKNLERVQAQLNGKNIRKEIYVPGKIINIVAN